MQQSFESAYNIPKLLSDQKDVQYNFDRVEVFTTLFPSYFKIESYFSQISSLNLPEDTSIHPANIIYRSDINTLGRNPNSLRLLFLTEPAWLLTEKFLSEANDVNSNAWQAGGGSLYGSKEALLMRRLDSYLDNTTDCNFLVEELTRHKLADGLSSDRTRLEIAKKTLSNNFHGIGISERLPETIFWFCSLLNWEQLPAVGADLIREYDGLPDFHDLPMKTKKKIRQRTQLDREIYEESHEELDKICDKLDSRAALSLFKQQLVFSPEWQLRKNTSSILDKFAYFEAQLIEVKRLSSDKLADLETQLIEVKRVSDDRLVQSQKAYHSLLKEHLIATNVIKDEK